jgi:hypothetical protein
VDEAIETEGRKAFKGLFVGNAGRTEEPRLREQLLFEESSLGLARARGCVVLRALDLYCLVVLAKLDRLDRNAFWKQFFDSKGALDCSRYLAQLPPTFNFMETTLS